MINVIYDINKYAMIIIIRVYSGKNPGHENV